MANSEHLYGSIPFSEAKYPPDDGYPTPQQIKAIAEEVVTRGGQKLSEITKIAQNAEPHTEFWGGIQTPITKSVQQANPHWDGGDNNTWKVTGPYPDLNTGINNNNWDITLEEIEAWAALDSNTTLPNGVTGTTAVKHDDNKPDWSLVPFESLEGMVKVLEFGAKKYAGWNWTNGGGFSYTRVLRSCLRHIFAYMRGEDNDPESGLSHIHHAMCNLLFISHYIGNKEKFNKDDRHVR